MPVCLCVCMYGWDGMRVPLCVLWMGGWADTIPLYLTPIPSQSSYRYDIGGSGGTFEMEVRTHSTSASFEASFHLPIFPSFPMSQPPPCVARAHTPHIPTSHPLLHCTGLPSLLRVARPGGQDGPQVGRRPAGLDHRALLARLHLRCVRWLGGCEGWAGLLA